MPRQRTHGFFPARWRNNSLFCNSALPRHQDAVDRLLLPITSQLRAPAPREFRPRVAFASLTGFRHFTMPESLRRTAWFVGGVLSPLSTRPRPSAIEPLTRPSYSLFFRIVIARIATRLSQHRDRFYSQPVKDDRFHDPTRLLPTGTPTPHSGTWFPRCTSRGDPSSRVWLRRHTVILDTLLQPASLRPPLPLAGALALPSAGC